MQYNAIYHAGGTGHMTRLEYLDGEAVKQVETPHEMMQ